MIDLIPLVLIALICIALGYALGSLISGLRGEKGRAGSPRAGHLEVVRVWRDRRKDNLVLEMDGKLAHMPGQLTAVQRTRLAQILEELRPWLGAPASSIAPETSRIAAARTASTPAAPAPAPAPKPPSMNPVDVLARAMTTDASKAERAPKSIAAQIDEILQEELEVSPMKNRAIRLMELPGKGMVVMVGLEQYDGVNSVPDPEIRQAIRNAVTEWERRTAG